MALANQVRRPKQGGQICTVAAETSPVQMPARRRAGPVRPVSIAARRSAGHDAHPGNLAAARSTMSGAFQRGWRSDEALTRSSIPGPSAPGPRADHPATRPDDTGDNDSCRIGTMKRTNCLASSSVLTINRSASSTTRCSPYRSGRLWVRRRRLPRSFSRRPACVRCAISTANAQRSPATPPDSRASARS